MALAWSGVIDDAQYAKVIREIRAPSLRICSRCGAPGRVDDQGRIVVLDRTAVRKELA
jgi:hypothetical protein